MHKKFDAKSDERNGSGDDQQREVYQTTDGTKSSAIPYRQIHQDCTWYFLRGICITEVVLALECPGNGSSGTPRNSRILGKIRTGNGLSHITGIANLNFSEGGILDFRLRWGGG